jgi:DNA-binding transcriptional LysR family regulator
LFNINRIDLNLFVVFDAIYTHGSVTRASQALNLTQPAVSHALGRLRSVIDDALFVRQGQLMAPTPIARELIGPVRRAIGEIEVSLTQLSAFDPAVSCREFRLGMRPLVEAATIPALIQRIQYIAPGIKISSEHHNRAEFQADLAAGTLAAVIDVLLPLNDNIRNRRLRGGKMVVVARRNHPSVQGHIDLPAYLAHEHVLASSRSSGPGMEDLELSRVGLQRSIRLRCQHFSTACNVVSMSDLLLTMPEHYARATNETLDNQVVPFPIDVNVQDIFLYWHARAEDDGANCWIRDNIISLFDTERISAP